MTPTRARGAKEAAAPVTPMQNGECSQHPGRWRVLCWRVGRAQKCAFVLKHSKKCAMLCLSERGCNMEQSRDQLVPLSVAVTRAQKARLAHLAVQTERSKSACIRLLLEQATPADLERRAVECAESRRDDAA